MAVDRRSFKYGVVAGVFLLVGVLAGVVFSLRMDWVPVAQGESAPAQAPAAANCNCQPGPNFVPIAKAAMSAVVNISTTRVIRTQGAQVPAPLMNDPFFRQFFGDQFRQFQVPRERLERALGSGVIVDPNGYIITNNHVIAHADKIKVFLSNNKEYVGKVVGADPKTDIAVVKIDAKDLPTLPWGDSDKLEPGQYVLAVGNPFGLNETVTMGIVSAVGRANVGISDYEDFIQTDAAINPGNSGGALVNTQGQLIGINTAIFTRSGGYMGIGFAVPSNMAREVMHDLIKYGKVIRGYLGVSIQEVTPELAGQFGLSRAHGALVAQVLKDSPAAKAGLKTGDVIVGYDGKDVPDATALRNMVAATKPDTRVKLEVVRDKRNISLWATIAEQPKNFGESAAGPSSAQPQTGALAGVEVRNLTSDIAQQLNLPPDTTGVVIDNVAPGSEGDQAGLQRGDVIVQINHQPVRNVGEYREIVKRLGPKGTALLLINRQGNNIYVVIKP